MIIVGPFQLKYSILYDSIPSCSILFYVTLQHPRMPGEYSSKAVPINAFWSPRPTLNLNLPHTHSAQTYVSVQNQTCGWALGQGKGNGEPTPLLALLVPFAQLGINMPLTVSYLKRRPAASLYNHLTYLPLSLTKTTAFFRLSFNGESVTAIKSCFFLRMRNNLGKPHLTQVPPTCLVKHSELI